MDRRLAVLAVVGLAYHIDELDVDASVIGRHVDDRLYGFNDEMDIVK